MCYDINYLTKKKSIYEKRYKSVDFAGLNDMFDEAGNPTQPVFHSVGFSHDQIPVIVNKEEDNSLHFELYEWGLIPTWVDTLENALKFQNNTLNARSETVFEKPAFRASIRRKRCLVVVDGFFEHKHQKNGKQPYYISLNNGMPLSLAGVWEDWHMPEEGIHKFTVSILTTQANRLMSEIHNNPKLEGPRMPVILPQTLENRWLDTIHDDAEKKEIQELLIPYPDEEMQAWPVRAIRGKNAVGNSKAALQSLPQQGSLFA